MNGNLTQYIETSTLCVLTTMLADGMPYSSTMHYAYDSKTSKFYFVADRNDTKCQLILQDGTSKASLVIGFDVEVWSTLQMRGEVIALEGEPAEFIVKTLFKDFTGLKPLLDNDDRIILEFTPTWWKFTDQASASIYTSENGEDNSTK
ncbi:MAG: hypothetical protein Fur003_1000 [Candidatus Dojkabacteria bacterium]